jgi:hypothetical protein
MKLLSACLLYIGINTFVCFNALMGSFGERWPDVLKGIFLFRECVDRVIGKERNFWLENKVISLAISSFRAVPIVKM